MTDPLPRWLKDRTMDELDDRSIRCGITGWTRGRATAVIRWLAVQRLERVRGPLLRRSRGEVRTA